MKNPEAVRRGKASKRKGKRCEKGWGDFVVDLVGGTAIVRHGDRDVQFVANGLEWHHSEVKGRKSFGFEKQFIEQAERDAAHHGLPRWCIPCKGDYKPWRCIVDARDYVLDMQELHERRQADGTRC